MPNGITTVAHYWHACSVFVLQLIGNQSGSFVNISTWFCFCNTYPNNMCESTQSFVKWRKEIYLKLNLSCKTFQLHDHIALFSFGPQFYHIPAQESCMRTSAHLSRFIVVSTPIACSLADRLSSRIYLRWAIITSGDTMLPVMITIENVNENIIQCVSTNMFSSKILR